MSEERSPVLMEMSDAKLGEMAEKAMALDPTHTSKLCRAVAFELRCRIEERTPDPTPPRVTAVVLR